MPVVVNNPRSVSSFGDGILAFMIGLTLMAVVGILFLVYALPSIQKMIQQNAASQAAAPTTEYNYTVPSQLDININRNVKKESEGTVNTNQTQPPPPAGQTSP